jgi:hypothetical protein
MPVEIYFPTALTIAFAPGRAVEIRAGEVLPLDEKLAARLRKHHGAIDAQAEHKDAPRISIETRTLSAVEAARVAPPLSEELLLRDFANRQRIDTLRAHLAASKK